MINIIGRTLDICGGERFLGSRSDNLTEIREFKITDNRLFDMHFKLDAEIGGVKNIYDLTKNVYDGYIILRWIVTNLHTAESGVMHIQLRGFDGENCVWRSNTDCFRIGESIYSTEDFTALTPSEFEEIEARVTELADVSSRNAAHAQSCAHSAAATANAVSLNRDNAAASEAAAKSSAASAESASKAAIAARDNVTAVANQITGLLSEQPRQFLVKTMTERDALTNLRQCDRCDVIDEKATFIYDIKNVDADSVNPEWILVSRWNAVTGVSWDAIIDKPEFSAIAYTGDYSCLINMPNRYESFLEVTDGIWTYPSSDKIILTKTNLAYLDGVYNGAIGMVKTEFDLTLPENSYKSADYDYLTLPAGKHWLYTFMYDGSHFHWNRTVCG